MIIASDGLATPFPGKKSEQTLRRLRHGLRQLLRSETPWLGSIRFPNVAWAAGFPIFSAD